MTTMAEVMGKALLDVHLLSGGDASYEEMALEVSDALRAAGFGHVPTALNEAADALDDPLQMSSSPDDSYNEGITSAANELRARATETGGTE